MLTSLHEMIFWCLINFDYNDGTESLRPAFSPYTTSHREICVHFPCPRSASHRNTRLRNPESKREQARPGGLCSHTDHSHVCSQKPVRYLRGSWPSLIESRGQERTGNALRFRDHRAGCPRFLEEESEGPNYSELHWKMAHWSPHWWGLFRSWRVLLII